MTQPFHVSYSGTVRAGLTKLLEEAIRQDSDFGQAAISAAKTIDARLRSAAQDFGDLHFTLEDLELDIRIAVIRPLGVTYAVHQRPPHRFRAALYPAECPADNRRLMRAVRLLPVGRHLLRRTSPSILCGSRPRPSAPQTLPSASVRATRRCP